ncbi:MAG: hypothetical protein F6K63_13790 [Moorea sp. SIO1G6]|nr:hypothetical protein [Moorena sp. SIO1G6]
MPLSQTIRSEFLVAAVVTEFIKEAIASPNKHIKFYRNSQPSTTELPQQASPQGVRRLIHELRINCKQTQVK